MEILRVEGNYKCKVIKRDWEDEISESVWKNTRTQRIGYLKACERILEHWEDGISERILEHWEDGISESVWKNTRTLRGWDIWKCVKEY